MDFPYQYFLKHLEVSVPLHTKLNLNIRNELDSEMKVLLSGS